ncbi:NB-ARC domain-containing protein [Acaryochloris marina]|uniref:WD repeat protein n=1 Tax=Acaryochloris marina (strain MBIC 11017) TaxID=329726 RepID=A8ZQX9_ACAM1|nr:NB-ARC domain-containing protein [Acaryochloris marina]ABW33415.1 WD repeat protein [Acaryochloris marina MBIC11017]
MTSQNPPEQQTILFLASNPDGLRQAAQELRDIEDGIQRSKHRKQFKLKSSLAVRVRDIQRALLDETPQIIHFAGSGKREAGLVFEDQAGNSQLVTGAALAGLFALFAEDIHCVILNGCYTQAQAQAIAQHIDYVVGMQQAISNEAALAFAVGFYDALGAGRDIEFAFKLGFSAIQIEGFPESHTPVLVQKSSIHTEPIQPFSEQHPPEKLWRVPELPPYFLPRPQTLKALREKVLNNLAQPVVMTGHQQRIGVQGMGGIGKSVLAAALAYDPQAQAAFPDGIYWLTVGIDPNLLAQQTDLAEALCGERQVFEDINEGKNRLQILWQGRQSLLILDDVWRIADAEVFNVLGHQSTLVVTTRDSGLITRLGATDFSLSVLNDDQALELLAAWVGVPISDLPSQAQAVAKECGNLPLALAQCGAMVRDLTPWPHVLSALQDSDLEFIQEQFSHYPYPDVFKALHISATVLAETNPIAAERYQELAVFPADELIPEAVIVRLWQYTGALKERDAGKILTTLSRKGMLRLEGDYPQRQVSLHDLQQDYLQAQRANKGALHQQLLEAYQQSCLEGWHKGPKDGYFYEHLAHHLKQAERTDELRQLLLDYRWMQRKLRITDINALLLDYETLPKDKDLNIVQSGLRLSSHVLNQHPEQLRSQLYGRLLSQDSPDVTALTQSLAQGPEECWIRCLFPHLNQAGGALVRTLSGHTSNVRGVSISPDGQTVVSASYDHTLKVWDLATGEEQRTLTGHTSPVEGVSISPDGQTVVSGSLDNTLKVWDLATGEEQRTLTGHTSPVEGVSISPDGQTVVSGSWDKTLKVWDLATGEEQRTLTGHTNSVYGVSISPDGQTVVSGSLDNTLKVWDLATGQEQRTLTGHTSPVEGVSISPDGQTVVSASYDHTLKVWDLATGEEQHTLTGHTDSVTGVSISPDGQTVVSASYDHTLKVWDLATGEEQRTLTGHTSTVTGVSISPDGQTVVSASWGKTLKVWDLATGEEQRTLTGHTNSVYGVSISPDGQTVVSGSSDKTLKVWDLATGEEQRTLTGHTNSVYGVSISPDGQTVVSGSLDKTLKVWDLATGEEQRTLTGHTSPVEGVSISPDGQTVVSGSWDKTLKVWDLATGEEQRTLTGHTNSVYGVSISPDGQTVVSGSSDKTLKVWDLATGEEQRTLTGHTVSVRSVSISPDGQTVVSGFWDKTLKVWDLATGEEQHTLTGHTDSVTGVSISPDGQTVVSGSWDKTLKVWDLATGMEVMSFTGEGGFQCCEIALDGRTIIAGDAGGQLYFLRLEGPSFSGGGEVIS